MLRKRMVAFAVLMAAGAVTLSACTAGRQAPPAPTGSPPAAQAGDTDLAGLSLLSDTAESNDAPAGTGDWAMPNGGAPTGAAAPVARKWVQLTAGKAANLDPVVVNGAGLTLYRFDKDTTNPSRSNCNDTDGCASKWPPVTVAPGGTIFISGVEKSAVGVVGRADGTHQVTIKGWPVYRFAKD